MKPKTRLDELVELLKQAPDEVFLQPHNVPDPDAISSCAGLQYLLAHRGVNSEIVYDKDLEKTDALLMLQIFGIEIRPAGTVETMGEEDWTVLVDVQKGSSNVTDLVTDEMAVIDHHENNGDSTCKFADIRPHIGACASIISSYFFENEIEPPQKIATALVFGIMKDTDNLTRGVSDLDIDMFYKMYRCADLGMIQTLNCNQLKMEDIQHYAKAFQTIEVYGVLGFMRLDCLDDSLLGSASDIVLSLDTVDVVVAYSKRPTGIKFSIRSENPQYKANALIRFILKGIGAGGGHDHMAGGFLPIANIPADKKIDLLIRHRSILFMETSNSPKN